MNKSGHVPLLSVITHVRGGGVGWEVGRDGGAGANMRARMLTRPHARSDKHGHGKVTVNKRSIYHHCHKSDAGSGSGI